MRIVVATNAFKGSLSATQAGEAIARGLEQLGGPLEIRRLALADGGDGFLESMLQAGGRWHTLEVNDPLGRPVEGAWGMLEDGTALIDMSRVSGLGMLRLDERDALRADSRGLGQAMAAALAAGATRWLVGIGGSASTDGGTGMLSHLGFCFKDARGKALKPGGASLVELATIDEGNKFRKLDLVKVQVACDVDNPLLGERGTAAVFAPQKGASPDEVVRLEAGLKRYADVVEKHVGRNFRHEAGTGAAGGVGFGLRAFLEAELVPGAELLLDAFDFDAQLKGADLVITCEGSLDGQTRGGKLPSAIARRAKAAGVPVVALAGRLGKGWEQLLEEGLSAAFSIAPGPVDLETSMKQGGEFLEQSAAQVMRLFRAARESGGHAAGRI